jgi:hypothetical protein
MADKESRQCPHFDISNGVCGCPEFWRPAQRSQHDRSSSALREVSSAHHSPSAPIRQVSSSVNSIPLPDRKKAQQVTPAPPGPPKETCFFWYHGSCRRGDECDRPHEAHPTWPIPPPPGFRHYQPCTLPLCPLRSDLAASDKPRKYHRRRTIGGQMDGAAFSRAPTAGESSSDSDNITNTDDTDMSKTAEDTYPISSQEILGLSTRHNSASHGPTDMGDTEGVAQASEVKAQETGRNSFEKSDYVDLSQLLSPSPPSTPLVKEKTLLSISHVGTLSKRRHSPTNSPKSNNKRVRLEEISAAELDNVTSLFERPRNMSQWDIKPSEFGLNGQHSESTVPYFAALHDFPAQLPTQLDNSFARYVPPPFDPPKGPRSMGKLPPICFFYYHKGYCKPKNGRRCDYLHDKSTSQQTVSLPHGIDNHDPSCSLLQCPVRLRGTRQVKQKRDSLAPYAQPALKYEPSISPRVAQSLFLEAPDSSPRDLTMSTRNRPQRGVEGRTLPRLTGLAKERFMEQKNRIEQIQATGGFDPARAASALETIHQRQAEKHSKHHRRAANRLKRRLVNGSKDSQLQSEEGVPTQQVPISMPNVLITQQPLPPFSVVDTPTAALLPIGGNHKRKKPRHRTKNKPRNRLGKGFLPGEFDGDEDRLGSEQDALPQLNVATSLPDLFFFPGASGRPFIDKNNQVGKERALGTIDAMDQVTQERRSSITYYQQVPSRKIVPHEYSQEALGLSSADRRAQVRTEQCTRREAWVERRRIQQDQKRVARKEKAHLAASSNSTGLLHQYNTGNDRVVEGPSCQRCCELRKGYDHASGEVSCLRCKESGTSAEDCVDRRPDDGQSEHRQRSLVDYQLPEGDQRLDWDTNLVRRLFGEIE